MTPARFLMVTIILVIGERSEPLSDKLGGEICIATHALVCIYLLYICVRPDNRVRPDDRTVHTLYVACAALAKWLWNPIQCLSGTETATIRKLIWRCAVFLETVVMMLFLPSCHDVGTAISWSYRQRNKMEGKKKDTEKRGRLKHEHHACNDLYLFIYFRTQADWLH